MLNGGSVVGRDARQDLAMETLREVVGPISHDASAQQTLPTLVD